MRNWWEVVRPHKNILEGKMSEALFAADLGEVADGTAPLEYLDSLTFFQRTYLTAGLRNLLENVLLRLSGDDGDPVIQLQTPFGGGKTHALLVLYHAIKNREKIDHLYDFSRLPRADNAKVVVFVGTRLDPIKGMTPWGEIAHQLGNYDLVKEHDEKRRSPGRDLISKVLGDGPVLILMDELVEYSVKARDFADQIAVFSQELTESVRAKKNACLVCTLPSSAPYGEIGERALNDLQMIYGRIESIYTPVEGMELYEIIRKRLFENIGDEKVRKGVSQAYFEMYRNLGADMPPEVKDVSYRDKIEHAYPFHPGLIDLLYERWGSYPTFQRTRGVLRLMAEVVADLYRRKVPATLIQSSQVNLENQTIRREFIKHIGNEYDSVITMDISGKDANSVKIDKEMGSEYEKYGIARGIATSVFLYSFSGSGKGGITLPWLRVALLREGIPSTIIGDAVNKLENRLWYFHSDGQQYRFVNQPNLNRVILDKEGTIPPDRVLDEVREQIRKNSGKDLESYLWPKDPADIPDNKRLKLAILSPDYTDYKRKNAEEFFEKAGSGFRVYKNTLFLITIDSSGYATLSSSIRNLIALSEIEKDQNILNTLSKEDKSILKDKLVKTRDDLLSKILSAYRHLAIMESSGVLWRDLGIPTAGLYPSISAMVRQHLILEGRLLSQIGPRYIIDRIFRAKEVEKEVKDIYETFLKTPGLAIPEDETVLLNAIKDGVRKGLIGLKDDSKVFYNEECSPTMESLVLRPEEARRIKEKEKSKGEGSKTDTSGAGGEGSGVSGGNGPKQPVQPDSKKAIKRLAIRAKIPWEHMNEVTSGVILPLVKKSEEIKLTIELKAEANDEFDENTINLKVRETLKQIGADIETFDTE